MSTEAKLVVAAVIHFLDKRAGFDAWWEDIDRETQAEIREDMAKALAPLLVAPASHTPASQAVPAEAAQADKDSSLGANAATLVTALTANPQLRAAVLAQLDESGSGTYDTLTSEYDRVWRERVAAESQLAEVRTTFEVELKVERARVEDARILAEVWLDRLNQNPAAQAHATLIAKRISLLASEVPFGGPVDEAVALDRAGVDIALAVLADGCSCSSADYEYHRGHRPQCDLAPAPTPVDTRWRCPKCGASDLDEFFDPPVEPAGDAGERVTHDQARAIVAGNTREHARPELERYIDQQEQTESERDRLVTELAETKARETRLMHYIGGIALITGTKHQEEIAESIIKLKTKLEAAEAERTKWLLEVQQLYESFKSSGHSPKNPREAAQAIGQMAEAEAERGHLLEAAELLRLGNLIPIKGDSRNDT